MKILDAKNINIYIKAYSGSLNDLFNNYKEIIEKEYQIKIIKGFIYRKESEEINILFELDKKLRLNTTEKFQFKNIKATISSLTKTYNIKNSKNLIEYLLKNEKILDKYFFNINHDIINEKIIIENSNLKYYNKEIEENILINSILSNIKNKNEIFINIFERQNQNNIINIIINELKIINSNQIRYKICQQILRQAEKYQIKVKYIV